jgi:hypothetical protein
MNSNKLKRKLMLRRMRSSAPSLRITSKSPVWVRLLLTFIGLALAAAAGTWLYEQGASFAGFNKNSLYQELEHLRAENKTLRDDSERLARASISSDSGLMIEKAMSKQIASQNQTLEAENAKLKEDLRFFESLLPARGGSDSISVRNLRGQLDVANKQLMVRLLVMQGGKHVNNFVGNLQISATGIAGGKPITWNYPTAGLTPEPANAKLDFSRYQRVELTIPLGNTLSKDAVLQSLQVRVMSNGGVKAQATGTVAQNLQSLDAAP